MRKMFALPGTSCLEQPKSHSETMYLARPRAVKTAREHGGCCLPCMKRRGGAPRRAAEHVVGLEVPVREALRVQVGKSLRQLRHEDLEHQGGHRRVVLRIERLDGAQRGGHKVHYEVK